MDGKENPVELLVMCAILIVLGILGVIAGVSKGLLGSMDGLLMLFISLMTALIFAGLLIVLVKDEGWIGKHAQHNGGSSSASGAGK